jgi:hypothetical protein
MACHSKFHENPFSSARVTAKVEYVAYYVVRLLNAA